MCEGDDGKAKTVANYSITFTFNAVSKQIAFPFIHAAHSIILRVGVIKVIKRAC